MPGLLVFFQTKVGKGLLYAMVFGVTGIGADMRISAHREDITDTAAQELKEGLKAFETKADKRYYSIHEKEAVIETELKSMHESILERLDDMTERLERQERSFEGLAEDVVQLRIDFAAATGIGSDGSMRRK